MPGIFGIVGYSTDICENLRKQFEAPWGSCQAMSVCGGIIGGHSFEPFLALNTTSEGLVYVIDGEVSAYEGVERGGVPFDLHSDKVSLRTGYKGNVAIADKNTGRWVLAADWLGIFPLYYMVTEEGLIFCSRQLPVAKLRNLSIDHIGVLSWMVFNYTFAGRTFFSNLRRLRGGQVLTYDSVKKRTEIRETSRAWVGDIGSHLKPDELADICWHCLCKAVGSGIPGGLRSSIMVSGGWDSRLLLAVLQEVRGSENTFGYFHGDPKSREARITRELCKSLSIHLHTEPIDDRVFLPESLKQEVSRTEDVTFPHWHHAGAVLRELGFVNVSAGVSGEIMGGRYGHVMRLSGIKKILEVARMLLAVKRVDGETESSAIGKMVEFLRVKGLSKPWFYNDKYWDAIEGPVEAMNADIELDVNRLLGRGVTDPEKLAEAFISEHWGAVYQGAQILSCRGSMNVSLPFADQGILEIASQIAIEKKIQNRLTQHILHLHLRDTLKLPTAAVLTPAYYPILVQEASRGIRKVVVNSRLLMHHLSKGAFNRPHFGWVDFEFLRSGVALWSIFGDLRAHIWNLEAIKRMILGVVEERSNESVHSVSEIMMKMYTIDFMLR